jgi:hypothetical protein
VGSGVIAGEITGSAVLGVFWALLADYVVMTLAAAEYPDGLVRRGTVAVLAAATGVLQLTVTVTVWGRAWTAVAAALAGAAAVHWIAAWLIAPAMARGQTGNQLRRIGLDACARRTWPAPGPMTWFPVATSTTATGTPMSNRHEPSPLPRRPTPVCS